VGVGWGDYVIAWLLTYNGADCRLWQYVYERCMKSELCRRVLELFPSIGLDVRKHKCYAELDTEIVEADQAPNQPKHPNHPTAQNHPSSSKHLSPRNKHLLKRSKQISLKLLSHLCPRPSREPSPSSQAHPPNPPPNHWWGRPR
jgi:hypothetical protein